MANTALLWKGAVEPAVAGGSGNEYQGWKGAVEPQGGLNLTVTAPPTTPVALVITTYQATGSFSGSDLIVTAPPTTPVALALTAYNASIDETVNGDSVALTITIYKATIGGGLFITAPPISPVALNITTYQADVRSDLVITPGGTVVGALEADIVSTGAVLTLTIDTQSGDTWIAADTGPIGTIAQSNAIVNGITSAQVEAGGWNAQIRDVLDNTALTRTSDTVATLTIPATAGYDITATETITATIPNAVLTLAAIDAIANTFKIKIASGDGGSTRSITRNITRGVV